MNKTNSKALVKMKVSQSWLPSYVVNHLRNDQHYVKSIDSICVNDQSTRSSHLNANQAKNRIFNIIKHCSQLGVIGDSAPGKSERVEKFKKREKDNMERIKKFRKDKKLLRKND